MTLMPRYPAALCLAAILVFSHSAQAQNGPLPEFTFQGVALHPDDLAYAPTEQLIHPTIISTQGRIENPLGKYYLYYAPHKHIAISMAYSDSLEGPWTEYPGNPVIDGPSAPDIRWIEDAGRFYMWGHRKNSQTELWTSQDGISFEHQGVSVRASNIGTRNATYTRAYEYPLARYGSRYIMLYSGFIEERGIRCVWLAHSEDAENWTQLTTPLVEPVEGENNDCYGPSLLQWHDRNFVVYQDHTTWRGGNVKYVEVDRDLNPVEDRGERFVLLDPPADPPLNDRYRGAEFYREDGTIYMYSSASSDPRIIVFATADSEPEALAIGGDAPRESPADSPLDQILDGFELETVYETTFDEPIRMVHEDDLIEDGKIAREPPADVDWVLEGPAEIEVDSGRMHIRNDPERNCVLWNTREMPESFVAEWDFQHHHPQGLAIFFFAAHASEGGSIFSPGLPKRGGRFGNYTRGRIHCYHTSYTAISEEGVPRGRTHLKKNDGAENQDSGNKVAQGPGSIDGRSGRPHRIRLAKLGNRIILEVDGEISFDWTDRGEQGGPPYGGGQIGFRQMAHTIEASYGGLTVQRALVRD